MSCASGCFEADVESCNDIIIRAGLPASFPFYWLISKVGNNNLHQRLTSTEINGDLVIPKIDLPLGFFSKGAQYKIQVKSGTDYLQPITLVFGGVNYTCIIATLKGFDRNDNDLSNVNVIHFTEALQPDGGSIAGSSFIEVTETDFTDATHLDNALIAGKTIVVFFNNIPRYLDEDVDFEKTETGINILIDGFDATQNAYKFIIHYE